MRCFIGVPLTQEIREELTALGKKLGKSDARMKLVEPENLHITMKFLGEIDTNEANEVKKLLNKIKEKPFNTKLTHLGAFPNKNYIRVLWVGIGEGKEKLKSIHDQIAHEKNYEPHITIARLKSRPDEVVMRLFEEELNLDMTVERIQLIESRLTPKGPGYFEVFAVELG